MNVQIYNKLARYNRLNPSMSLNKNDVRSTLFWEYSINFTKLEEILDRTKFRTDPIKSRIIHYYAYSLQKQNIFAMTSDGRFYEQVSCPGYCDKTNCRKSQEFACYIIYPTAADIPWS